jgi:hypothetical protein
MAVNSSRSMNAGLREGVTDGKYRKARPNTELDPAGQGGPMTARERKYLNPFQGYGYVTTELPPAERDDETYPH